jgi:hypothetical protein
MEDLQGAAAITSALHYRIRSFQIPVTGKQQKQKGGKTRTRSGSGRRGRSRWRGGCRPGAAPRAASRGERPAPTLNLARRAGRDSHQEHTAATQTSDQHCFPVNPCRTMCCSRWPTSELSPTCMTARGAVVRTDHHTAGERSGSTQQYDLKVHHASVQVAD